MTRVEALFITRQMHAMRAHAEIVSGAYKLTKSQQGREPTAEEKAQGIVIGWRDKSDSEKLADKVAEMNRHIHLMYEAVDYMDDK